MVCESFINWHHDHNNFIWALSKDPLNRSGRPTAACRVLAPKVSFGVLEFSEDVSWKARGQALEREFILTPHF